MTVKEGIKFIEIIKDVEGCLNKTIEIVSISNDDEVYFNAGMRGEIVNVVKHDWDDEEEGYLEIYIDFAKFEEYNEEKMERVFYGKDKELLKWIELPVYTRNKGVDSIYVMKNSKNYTQREEENRFNFLNDNFGLLYSKFKESNEENYLTFLETIAIENLIK